LWMFQSREADAFLGAFYGVTPSNHPTGRKAKQRFRTPRGTAYIRAGESFFQDSFCFDEGKKKVWEIQHSFFGGFRGMDLIEDSIWLLAWFLFLVFALG
jgi:hypothetical protein